MGEGSGKKQGLLESHQSQACSQLLFGMACVHVHVCCIHVSAGMPTLRPKVIIGSPYFLRDISFSWRYLGEIQRDSFPGHIQ